MERVRVGVVGCGEVTQIIHLPTLYQLGEQFQVTALCDISPKVLNGVGDHWGIDKRFEAYQDLVQQEDVDAVLIANPHAYHAEVTLAAVAAGKHVLVEKPMCISQQEAEQIIAARDRAGVIVQVGYMRRYAPAFLEARRLVGEMDQIRLARVHDVIGRNALIIEQTSRVIRADDLPDAVKRETKALQNQKVLEALGADTPHGLRRAYLLMLGLSSHDLSAMRELLGMPKRVLYAVWHEDTDLHEEVDRPEGTYLTAAFDYGSFVCQFETGIDDIPRFDGHLEVFSSDRVLRVQYDTPYVRNLPIRLKVVERNENGGVVEQSIHPAWGDPFVAEWQSFHESVTQGKPPKSNPEDFCNDLKLFAEMIQVLCR